MSYEDRKKTLEDYKKGLKLLNDFTEQYSKNLEKFNEENKILSSNIDSIRLRVNELKESIKIDALEDFKVNNNKKMLGGVSVRIIKKYDYDENTALSWAKQNDTCLTLNKKDFKKIIKTNDLPFVNKFEEASIVVPSKIIFGDDE